MSNLGAFGGAKNPPWARTAVTNASNNLVNQNNALQQQLLTQGTLSNMGPSGMVQFQQQQQVFQNALGMQQQNLSLGLQQMANPAVSMAGISSQLASNQLFQQVGTVTYPNPRALNPTAFQTQPVQNTANSSTKQRVFTGTVTKVHDNFGFIDEEVFFQTSACVKGSNPMVGDRVLVEASFNPNMPFKWNATRIQVLPTNNQSTTGRNSNNQKLHAYNVVPPPDNTNNFNKNVRPKPSMGGRGRERSRDRDRDDDEPERKKRRDDRVRDREKEDKKSPLRRRSRSPKSRRRSRIVPRYMVQIPKINLDLKNADVLEVRRRYSNLYIPSDFFCSSFKWVDAFPPDKPFSLSKPALFHIMHKEVNPIVENDAVLEPADADYLFSAKVMLMSVPGMEEIYQKCCAMAEDKDKRDRESEERDFVHPTRLIQFLVGLRAKNETMAIGGPWSSSLDGASPDQDPSVLINTAIRTCKALTGIDLSPCTQWYRFLELYYHRNESTHKGKVIPARVETVVIFLPDVWSCLPTRLEWDNLHLNYRKQLENKLKADQEADEQPAADEKEEEPSNENKLEPTHYSLLDPKNMSIISLRDELKARGINGKGIKSQLIARLSKSIKNEAEKTEDSCNKESESEQDVIDDKKLESEERKLDEKEKAMLEKRYTLPEPQHILVHPSRIAKSGKFDCTSMSLSLLLDYRPEDTKEHSFEVSLFAELFNEMLMRDFGFNIYRALYELPEKVKEKDDKKKRDEDKKTDENKKKEEDKKKDDEKKKDELDKKSDKDKKEEKKKEDEKKRDEERRKDNKREEKRSETLDDSEDDDFDDDEDSKDKRRSDKDKRKKERPRMFTKDRQLLLSFVYFDQTHCGYIFEKDMEDLLFTLGLQLSRAQVRKLVGKVITRDSLHYRKLTDKVKDDTFIVIDDSEKDVSLEELAVGNKKLLWNHGSVSTLTREVSNESNGMCLESNDGIVTFRGAVVDILKLMAQLERSEKARTETENRMIDLKNENIKITDKYNKSSINIKSLNLELKEYKEKLKTSEDNLIRLTAYHKMLQTTLIDIRTKIDPVLKSTTYTKEETVNFKREKDFNDKEKKTEEIKTRWEKNSKDTIKEEIDSDVTEVSQVVKVEPSTEQ